MKKAIKRLERIPIEDVLVFPDAIVRQSLLKASRKEKVQNIKELAASMKVVGLLQPIGVYEYCCDDEAKYQLVIGYRRFLAAQFLKWEKILAVILTRK